MAHLDETRRYIENDAAKHGVPIPFVDFDYVLDMSSNAFPVTRYIYEGLPGGMGWVAGGILEVVRQVILEMHPDWDKLEMVLGVQISD